MVLTRLPFNTHLIHTQMGRFCISLTVYILVTLSITLVGRGGYRGQAGGAGGVTVCFVFLKKGGGMTAA